MSKAKATFDHRARRRQHPSRLSATADRIEHHGDGSVSLIDYKTGTPPGMDEVRVGFAPQLTLEAAMARRGAFGLPEGTEVAEAIYVKLFAQGRRRRTAAHIQEDQSRPLAEVAEKHFAELRRAAQSVPRCERRAIRRGPIPKFAARYSAYDHLARVKEWAAEPRGWRMSTDPAARHRLSSAKPPIRPKSVWVSANAGSGKTHVLAQRVLRLLLAGVPPAKILCLTFTKAAAANMAERVFKALSEWTALDDAALAKTLAEIGAPKIDARTLIFARRLFARTVETPGGLKIHTIHGFCERLLHLFPFEANVPGRFEVLDDLGQAELLALARREALLQAERDEGALGAALADARRRNFAGRFQSACSRRR